MIAEVLGFGLALAVALFVAWLIISAIARGWIAEETASFEREKQSDLKAVRRDPEAFRFNTVNGACFIGPSGRIFSKDDVFPVVDHQAERAELRP